MNFSWLISNYPSVLLNVDIFEENCHFLLCLCRIKMYPSRKMYSPQAFVSFWKPFIRIFQVFCVSHYSLFHSSEHIGRLIYYITFSSLHIALMVYTLANGLIIQMRPSNKYKESTLMFYVNSISVAGNFVTHTVAHLEPLFTRKYEEEIYRKLNDINEMFALKLNYVVNFDAIRNKFIRRTMLFFTITASISIGYSFYSLPSDGDTLKTFLFLLNRVLGAAIIRARRCQLAFLVNTLSNTLLDLQILLKRQQQNYRPNSANSSANSSENIRYLRDIYSTVWLLKNLISNCFGWSFISFLMEFSFDLINSSYWAYINVKIYDSNNMIIRNLFDVALFMFNGKHFCLIFFFFSFQKSFASSQPLPWIFGTIVWFQNDVKIW